MAPLKFAALFVFGVFLAPISAIAAPANDSKANASMLDGLTATASVDNTTATKESGDFGERTVWWKWTAPANGTVTLDTLNSVPLGLGIAVYLDEGGTVTGAVSSSSFTTLPTASFPVTLGATYLIGLGHANTNNFGVVHLGLTLVTTGQIGTLPITRAATMANNAFANRLTLSGDLVAAVGYNISATRELGEPSLPGANTGENTLWWTYRPSATGRLNISNEGTDFTTNRISVFLGDSVTGLRLVAQDEAEPFTTAVSFSFPVTAGTEYQICVASASATRTGSTVLGLELATDPYISGLNVPLGATMINDNFGNRLDLVGNSVAVICYNASGTEDLGEPIDDTGRRTFWWTYQPSVSGKVTISTKGTDFTISRVAVFLGSTVNGLTLVAAKQAAPFTSETSFSFLAKAGTRYQISVGSGGSESGSAVVSLAGQPEPPNFSSEPTSQFVAVGNALQLSGLAFGGPVRFQWLKNGSAVSRATTPTFQLAGATLANAGAYSLKATNNIGSKVSGVANVGVVNTSSTALTVNEFATIKLTAPVAGPKLKYRWRKGGADITDIKLGARVVSGSGTANLSVTLAAVSDDGNYNCHVMMDDPQNPGTPLSADTGMVTVSILPRPVVNALNTPSAGIVTKPYSWVPSASNSPSGYVISGLPSGLSFNGVTSAVSGIPNVGGSFKIKVAAKNAAGTGLVQEFTLNIAPLPAGTTGSFSALITRHGINANIGGYITLKVASTGTFTGTLKNGISTHSIKGRLVAPLAGDPIAQLTIPRKSPAVALTLNLTFQDGTNTVTGNLTDGADSGATLSGRRSIWAGTAALSYAAVYNSSVDLPVASLNDVAQPLGVGWQQMTVTAAGAASGTGRTAAGISYTFSGPLWPDGSLPQFVLIHSNKGSIMGLPKITLGATVPDNRVSGWVDEIKTGRTSSKDRTYAAGIPLLQRVVDGAPWIKPTAASPIVLGRNDVPNNASIVFSKGGVDDPQFDDLNQTFRINRNNTTTFNAATLAAGNPFKVAMTITQKTGMFSGSFTLPGTVSRTVKYYGLFLSHQGKGVGYFLLPELTPTPTTSSILGGRVEVPPVP